MFHEPGPEAMTRTPFTAPLIAILADADREGTLQVGDIEEAATVLVNQVGWTDLHLRSGHRWPPERAARVVIDTALHGVLAR